jgi:hypothetical protein
MFNLTFNCADNDSITPSIAQLTTWFPSEASFPDNCILKIQLLSAQVDKQQDFIAEIEIEMLQELSQIESSNGKWPRLILKMNKSNSCVMSPLISLSTDSAASFFLLQLSRLSAKTPEITDPLDDNQFSSNQSEQFP